MIYKDCIHYEACKDIYYPMSTYDEEAKAFDESDSCDGCQFYSDKSRFTELPCKVGDTVYMVMSDKRIKRPYEYKVIGFWYNNDENCNNVYLVRYINGIFESSTSVYFSEFGKTVFLTREEAEKALKARDKDNG